jgi:hypothetical protein
MLFGFSALMIAIIQILLVKDVFWLVDWGGKGWNKPSTAWMRWRSPHGWVHGVFVEALPFPVCDG